VAGVEGTKPQTSVEFEAPKSETAAPAPDKPKDESFVKPIETYQSDIEKLVQDKNVSVLTIAAAEAERRSKNTSATTTGLKIDTQSLIEKIKAFGQLFISKDCDGTSRSDAAGRGRGWLVVYFVAADRYRAKNIPPIAIHSC